MPTYIRVKDLPNAATSPAADDFILLSGTANGARKISRSDFIAAIASQIVAAPSTYKIATLDGADKLTSSQDPSQSVSYLGGHDMVANSPALADGSGTAGDTYYVTNPGTRNYGSGNITAQEGDALVYSGSVWQLVEGIANILDGISTASTARTTLEVNSIDEDAQANALKVTSPALYFDGSNDYIEVSDDDKFSFTDGTDDLPFSVSAFVKVSDIATGTKTILSKFTTAGEYLVYINGGKLRFLLRDASVQPYFASASLSAYDDTWIHVCFTYDGAGPNSTNGFATAINGVKFYINGVDDTSSGTVANDAGYTGMSNTANPLRIGRDNGSGYFKGSIRDCKIFNRSLTSTEVAELARGNDLGFSEEFGGALGGAYSSDFSAGANAHTADGGTVDGNIDDATSGTGEDDTLRLTINSSTGNHQILRNITSFTTTGKRYRFEADIYVPSTNATVDAVEMNNDGTGGVNVIGTVTALDTWTHISGDLLATYSEYRFRMKSGSSYVFAGNGTDVIYVKNVKITALGTLADFRAERYDTSTNKLYCLSDNAFVGTGTSVSLTGREVPVYETGTWTPVYSPATGSFTAITMDVTDGTYTRVGNIVTVSAYIKTDNLDVTGASGNLQITGLPFTANGIAAGSTAFTNSWTTHPVACWVSDNSTLMFLGKQTSLGGSTTAVQVSDMQDGAVANANAVYITATYQIK